MILASPVDFRQVTAQFKTFLDRCRTLGHRPRAAWKPGLAVSVSAGWGETEVARYLALTLRAFGAFAVILTAIAVGPGHFLGKELVAAGLLNWPMIWSRRSRRNAATRPRTWTLITGASWVAWCARTGTSCGPITSTGNSWGILDSFEAYVGQSWETPVPRPRPAGSLAQGSTEPQRQKSGQGEPAPPPPSGPEQFANLRDLLVAMPRGPQPGRCPGTCRHLPVSGERYGKLCGPYPDRTTKGRVSGRSGPQARRSHQNPCRCLAGRFLLRRTGRHPGLYDRQVSGGGEHWPAPEAEGVVFPVITSKITP